MEKSFRTIDRDLASRIRLIMTDVDGTLLSIGNTVSRGVAESISALGSSGITTGLVSGRTLPELESMAYELGIIGPVIAENGAVAKLAPGEPLLELGYSREAALAGLKKLKSMFPGSIHEREDNKDRIVDVVFRADGLSLNDIRRHLGTTQLLDSGYILHLMQPGINKGKTLKRVLDEFYDTHMAYDEVMVFGDSATDLSLFELFSSNVLVINPNLPDGQTELMQERATYISERQYGEGFLEVALHIIKVREND